MKNRNLFLFGGSPPFGKKLGSKFANCALNKNGKAAILFVKRDGWKAYMEKYTCVLEDNGLDKFLYVPLSPTPDKALLNELSSCTGIIIGGGDTELYRNFIVDTLLGKLIKEMYHQGVPVAGFSAGALISPEHCIISPIDNQKNEHLFLNGLGLIKNCVICVHYSKWNEEGNLTTALEKVNVPIGFGIDDGEGLYFKNEILLETEGDGFYKFE